MGRHPDIGLSRYWICHPILLVVPSLLVIPSAARDLGFCLQLNRGGGAAETQVPRCARDDRREDDKRDQNGLQNSRYRMASMNVTLLISFSVVMPSRTLSSADSRRKRIPSSRAARRISDVGFLARIISRMRSLKSSNS
jgi:hypothetical protein